MKYKERKAQTCGHEKELTVMAINNKEFMCCTFLGEKTPRVPPSSRMATPISARSASLRGGKENIIDITNQHIFINFLVSIKDIWNMYI